VPVWELVDVGLLVLEDDGSFVAEPRLLDLTVRMLDAGVSIDIGARGDCCAGGSAVPPTILVDLFESETVARSPAGSPGGGRAALDVPDPSRSTRAADPRPGVRTLAAVLAGRAARSHKKR
jgi:hypothetical protein